MFSKIQLEKMISLKYGVKWLRILAGGYFTLNGYREGIERGQCRCTEEEFLSFRHRAIEKLKEIDHQ